MWATVKNGNSMLTNKELEMTNYKVVTLVRSAITADTHFLNQHHPAVPNISLGFASQFKMSCGLSCIAFAAIDTRTFWLKLDQCLALSSGPWLDRNADRAEVRYAPTGPHHFFLPYGPHYLERMILHVPLSTAQPPQPRG